MLKEALDYYERHLVQAVLPTKGKVPLVVWKPYQEKRQTKGELRKIFSADNLTALGATGLGIVLGGESGLVRLDCDDEATFERLKPLLPDGALTFKTPRGYGVILRHTGSEPVKIVPEGTIDWLPKFGIKAWGGFTVLPPTEGYRWLSDHKKPIITMDINAWLELHFVTRKQPDTKQTGGVGGEIARLLRDTSEGERSNSITRVVNMLRARGFGNVDDIIAVVKPYIEEWPWTGEPMDWEEAERIVKDTFNRYKQQGQRFDEPAAFEGEVIDPTRPRGDRSKKYLIEGLLAPGDEGNLVMGAATKMGKTSMWVDIAVTASRGDLALGKLKVPRPLRVAILDQERNYEQILDNIDRMEPVIGKPNWDNILILAGKTEPVSISNKAGLDWLFEQLRIFKPDIFILDGWSWFVDDRTSDAERVNPAIRYLFKIRSELYCATVVIHHFKKESEWQSPDGLDAMAGLKILVNQARVAITYMPVKDYDTFGVVRGRCNSPSGPQ